MSAQRVRLFPENATAEQKAVFARELIAALRAVGVQPGDEFVVRPAFEQGDLLAATANRIGPSQSHSATSKNAAIDNYPRSGSQRHRVLVAIATAGERGKTRDELEIELQLPGSSVRPRVVELESGDFITAHPEKTRTTQNGSEARVLVLTERGQRMMRTLEPGLLWEEAAHA